MRGTVKDKKKTATFLHSTIAFKCHVTLSIASLTDKFEVVPRTVSSGHKTHNNNNESTSNCGRKMRK